MSYSAVTLADLAKLQAADGSPIPKLVENLSQTNEILADMLWKPTNEETSEIVSIRNGFPEAAWRKLNYGVKPSKGDYTTVRETCGMLEARTQIDAKMYKLNGASAEFRVNESRGVLETFNRTVAGSLFYADQKVDAEKITGIAPRFSKLSTDSTKSGYNVIDAGGSTNLTSIYMVCWGLNTAYGIVPRNSTAGFNHQDLGELDAEDTDGGKYRALVDLFQWDLGLCVRDWRYIVRIANIDVTALTKDKSAGADLTDLMIQATEQVPDLNLGSPVFYCGKTIRSFLRRQILNTKNIYLTPGEVAGKHVTMFDGIPVRRVDQILNSETKVTA